MPEAKLLIWMGLRRKGGTWDRPGMDGGVQKRTVGARWLYNSPRR